MFKGTTEQTAMVVQAGAVPLLIDHFSTGSSEMQDQVKVFPDIISTNLIF